MGLYFQYSYIEEQLMSLYSFFFNSCIINAVLDVSSHVSSMSFRLFVICVFFNVPVNLRLLCHHIHDKELNNNNNYNNNNNNNNNNYYYYYYVQNA